MFTKLNNSWLVFLKSIPILKRKHLPFSANSSWKFIHAKFSCCVHPRKFIHAKCTKFRAFLFQRNFLHGWFLDTYFRPVLFFQMSDQRTKNLYKLPTLRMFYSRSSFHTDDFFYTHLGPQQKDTRYLQLSKHPWNQNALNLFLLHRDSTTKTYLSIINKNTYARYCTLETTIKPYHPTIYLASTSSYTNTNMKLLTTGLYGTIRTSRNLETTWKKKHLTTSPTTPT